MLYAGNKWMWLAVSLPETVVFVLSKSDDANETKRSSGLVDNSDETSSYTPSLPSGKQSSARVTSFRFRNTKSTQM